MPATSRLCRFAVPLVALLSVTFGLAPAAQAAGQREDLVKASLLADTDAVTPGGNFLLGVRLAIKRPWHTYWVNPGESGQATQIKMTGPAGFAFGAVQWPLPTRLEHDGTVTYGYEDEVLLLVPVTVDKDAPAAKDAAGGNGAAKPVRFDAAVTWLSCQNETCVEGQAKLSLDLPVKPTAGPANRELFHAWRRKLPVARDRAAAVAGVDQPAAGGGVPASTLTVRWAQPPRKVEWFPVATEAVAIGDIALDHQGKTTTIKFKPTVYKADGIPDNRVDSLLVYEDAAGVRQGVMVPFAVAAAGQQAK